MWRHAMTLLLASAVTANSFGAPTGQPDQGVARASYVEGNASYLRGDDSNRDDWSALGVNTPLTTGDSLYTAPDARAELTLGGGDAVRLDHGTEVDVVSLTSGVTQFGLSSGRAELHIRTLGPGAAIEMDTPGGAATVTAPGTYRFVADANGSDFGVISGGLSVVVSGQTVDVRSGEDLRLNGTSAPTYALAHLDGPDDFDRWSAQRDARFDSSLSARYVNPQVNGFEDLDTAGQWRQDPTYGNVWVPSGVSAGWAPYQDGCWTWQDPYGWTWVSYEPWGWAPYHYGRWVYVSDAWSWVPPPPPFYAAPAAVVGIQPFYAPALVGFFGVGGSGWSLGIALGFGSPPALGWVPLAPADPFFYPWQSGYGVTNVSYTNINVVNACTVVRQDAFGTGPVSPMRLPPERLRTARMLGSQPAGIVPTAASLAAYPNRRVSRSAVPSAAITSRPLAARLTPPPRPTPFQDKLSTIRATGRPVAEPVMRTSTTGRPFSPGAAPVRGFVPAMKTVGPASRSSVSSVAQRTVQPYRGRGSSGTVALGPQRGHWTPRTPFGANSRGGKSTSLPAALSSRTSRSHSTGYSAAHPRTTPAEPTAERHTWTPRVAPRRQPAPAGSSVYPRPGARNAAHTSSKPATSHQSWWIPRTRSGPRATPWRTSPSYRPAPRAQPARQRARLGGRATAPAAVYRRPASRPRAQRPARRSVY